MIEEVYDKIIKSHKREGKIEEAYLSIQFKKEKIFYNHFTLRLKRWSGTKFDVDDANGQLLKRIKRNPQLYKEIREFNLIFRFFKKLKIQSGYLKKSETPDFILERGSKKSGIEVTRIYAGNDWVAEKMHHDIQAYRLQAKELPGYMKQKKYDGKIITYQTQKGIVVKAVKEKENRKEEMIQIKNKIFEKIRKQADDYTKYDENFIFAEIVFTDYNELERIEELQKEINFFVSHLDIVFGQAEFHLILKLGNTWTDFNLKTGTHIVLR